MSLAERVKSLRNGRGWSVRELAQQSGVSIPYVHQIENGTKENPTGEILQKLAGALEVTVTDLLGPSPQEGGAALEDAPASLKKFVRKRGRQLGVSAEDIASLKAVRFRGRQPSKVEDWELVFLFLKKILG